MDTEQIAYYVTVRRDSQTGYLLGPFACHDEALALVDTARDTAEELDRFAYFYAFGTAKVTARQFRPGRLNTIIGIVPTV